MLTKTQFYRRHAFHTMNAHCPKFFQGSYQDCPWEHACQIWNSYL